eukprot:13446018-Ditylum_brightwellii.AAC.1
MVTRIEYLTMIHPKRIYCASCQEHLNKALATVALELDEENKNYFSDYGIMWELANYNVQLKPTTPLITISNKKTEMTALAVYAHQAHLLKEQNQFLGNYKDFRISRISEDMIDTKFGESTSRDLLELPGVVGDITPTPFTKTK